MRLASASTREDDNLQAPASESQPRVILAAERVRYAAGMRRIHSILLVEDDRALHKAMTDILDAEGYRVIGAFDGQEAIDRLREGARPSVILLDMMMPRKDGYQFRAEQLADPRLAPIPVIAYSGGIEVADAAKTLGSNTGSANRSTSPSSSKQPPSIAPPSAHPIFIRHLGRAGAAGRDTPPAVRTPAELSESAPDPKRSFGSD
jgi:CheY-like chemotaxis protein